MLRLRVWEIDQADRHTLRKKLLEGWEPYGADYGRVFLRRRVWRFGRRSS